MPAALKRIIFIKYVVDNALETDLDTVNEIRKSLARLKLVCRSWADLIKCNPFERKAKSLIHALTALMSTLRSVRTRESGDMNFRRGSKRNKERVCESLTCDIRVLKSLD